MISELRLDRITGDWVIIAPQRSARPQPVSPVGAVPPVVSRFDPACPFCPGNEAQLPDILAEVPSSETLGWQVRTVPNKYPAVSPDAPAPEPWLDGQRATGAYGFHEVVVESPRHDVVSMSNQEIDTVLSVYHRRFLDLLKRPRIQTVILFRNRGQASGASLEHPHAQLVALNAVPPWMNFVTERAREHYQVHSRCIVCDELELEQRDGKRVIEETECFLAVVPFAATVPFEIWLIPKRHRASFTEVDEHERANLGALLQRTLRRLREAQGDPAYRFVMDSASKADLGAPYMHWRLRIAPDLVGSGGFELATRMPINPSSPERDAEVLRKLEPRPV